MSTIDEIMGAVGRHGDDCIRDGDAASESFEALRELIAAALTEARREGAEAMKNACAQEAIISAPTDSSAQQIADNIRALPLPTGERQVVLLTRQQIDDLMTQHYPLESLLRESVDAFEAAVRDVEAAIIAANGLEVRRG